jgi:hypothetical protein
MRATADKPSRARVYAGCSAGFRPAITVLLVPKSMAMLITAKSYLFFSPEHHSRFIKVNSNNSKSLTFSNRLLEKYLVLYVCIDQQLNNQIAIIKMNVIQKTAEKIRPNQAL